LAAQKRREGHECTLALTVIVRTCMHRDDESVDVLYLRGCRCR
jgi:hypothetical protein